METGIKGKSGISSGTDPLSETIESIKKLAAKQARAPLNTEEHILLFLQSWWSRIYNRPLKDPVLLSYSLEELLYEFYDRIEREKVAAESIEQESDNMEKEKEKKDMDWAEQEERKELEEAMRNAKEEAPVADPTTDAANLKWMEEQLRKQKDLLGDDFGEDVSLNFDE